MQATQMQQWLAARQQQGLMRQEICLTPLADGLISKDGLPLLNFSGNDYLGLGFAPEIRQAAAAAAHSDGVAATGSPLLTGYSPAQRDLAAALCDWLGCEDVLLFSSGFAANQAMLAALWGPDELLLLDKYCHASMQDLLSSRRQDFRRFAHQDLAALQQLQQKAAAAGQAVLVATEGVFSMDGDITDVAALAAQCGKKCGSKCDGHTPLLLDDAHGLGVLGEEGRGSWQHHQVPLRALQCLMGNFGKALAGQGGFLAGSFDVIEFIRQQARHYIYSTALSPQLCRAMQASIMLCRKDQWRRDKLNANIALFRERATAAGLALLPSQSAIQPVLMRQADTSAQPGAFGKNSTAAQIELALRASQQLQQQGIWLSAIRPPTVPSPRLRVSLSASHNDSQICQLVSALAALQG